MGQTGPGICANSIPEIVKAKRAGSMTQLIQCLLSKHKAPSLNSSTNNNKK
jgi:hypothetical protein